LYDRIRTADVPQQRVLEATRGAILARQVDGIPLLAEQLESDDKRRFAIGISTARELSGRDVTEALVAELGKTTPDRQVLLILALADRDDSAVLPAILEAAAGGPSEVRVVAIGVLKRVGNASSVSALLDMAIETDAELADAAMDSLEGLPGQDVDADLAARLSQAEGPMRRLLIELVGLRRIEAIPDLLKAADDADREIRLAALTALGSTVGPEDLSVLVTRVVAPKSPEDSEVAKQALHAASIRMPDREACAEELVSAMSQAPVAAKCAMLETLGAMGGAKALQSVASAAQSDNAELQDAATRLLGQWMTADAAPALLDVATSSVEKKYRIRALRGYIRIARQFAP
jgi:HEAT repeat protein